VNIVKLCGYVAGSFPLQAVLSADFPGAKESLIFILHLASLYILCCKLLCVHTMHNPYPARIIHARSFHFRQYVL